MTAPVGLARPAEVGGPVVVIVGAGQAGAELAFSLRREGHEGRIVLLGNEVMPPYQRPPLSKKFLVTEAAEETLWLRGSEAYDKARIEVRLGVTVASIQRDTKHVVLDDGELQAYDWLALATGGQPRQLPQAETFTNMHTIRTIGDSLRLRSRVRKGARVLVIGGGFIGLEAAAAARSCGAEATLVEVQPVLMSRLTSPAIGQALESLHRSRGVVMRMGTQVSQLVQGADQTIVASFDDGSEQSFDDVIVGIGMLANSELARAAGLRVDRGICVDRFARTDDPHIVAVGDCTETEHSLYEGSLRLESVHNATEQARTAAATICGASRPYEAVPWFWSDQYETHVRIAGVFGASDEVVYRGDPSSDSFSVLHHRDGVLTAVEAVNSMEDFAAGRRLIRQGSRLDFRALDAGVVRAHDISADDQPSEAHLTPT